jgi:hypothetical protein
MYRAALFHAVLCYAAQIQKGSVRVFLRFDAINQIVFDDVEPRSVLIGCRDDRRCVTFVSILS